MSSSSGSGGVLSYGKVSELFRYDSVTVMQLSYDDERKHWLKAEGHFVVTLIVQMAYSILMTVCAVDGFKWPLTKDIVIIRLAERTFAIVLPGLFYGLRFPPSCKEAIVESLVKVFMKYGHYLDLKKLVNVYPVLDNESDLWLKVRPRIQFLAHDILRGFGLIPGRSQFWVPNEDSSLVRAVRMSAATKLIENVVCLGIFNLTHIIISPNQLFGGSSDRLTSDIAYASVTVFTYVVDTVEISWLMSKGFGSLLNQMLPSLHVWPCPRLKVWRLNDRGLTIILHQMGTSTEKEENLMEKEKEEEKEREMALVSAREKGKQIIFVDSEEDDE